MDELTNTFERASIPQRLGLFMLISLLTHLTVIITIFVVSSITANELPEPLSVNFVTVTPVPVPREIAPEPIIEPVLTQNMSTPAVEAETVEPEIAEQPTVEPLPTEESSEAASTAPIEEVIQDPAPEPAPVVSESDPESVAINEPTPTEEPTPEHDVNVAETAVAQDMPDSTGELDIESGEGAEPAELEPAGEPATTDVPDGGVEANVEPSEPEPAPEERDGRVQTPEIVSMPVSDRINGHITFAEGRGRELTNRPPAFDFALTQNTEVTITFRIDEQGRTNITRMSPIANRDLEQKIINFVNRMRFTFIPGQTDTATLHMTLTVR